MLGTTGRGSRPRPRPNLTRRGTKVKPKTDAPALASRDAMRCLAIAEERIQHCKEQADIRAENSQYRAANEWDARHSEALLIAEIIRQEFRV